MRFILMFVAFAITSCSRYPADVEYALTLAGDNRAELEQILEHYRSRPEARLKYLPDYISQAGVVGQDSLKYRAAKFLIANMVYHASAKTSLATNRDETFAFDVTKYSTREAVQSAVDSLIRIYRLKQEIQYDYRVIGADYLVRHIEQSMEVWQQSPWRDRMDFGIFCQYVLPYKAQNEPVSEWQTAMRQRYRPVIDSMNPSTSIEACKAINSRIARHIRYDNRWMAGLGSRSVEELLASSSGMCDDLTVYGACAMRSVGIPVAVDFTIWPFMNMGHSWCVVFDENGQAHSFGPGEQQPGEHIEIFSKKKMAKVFRLHFDAQKNSLAYINRGKEELPPFFRSYNISDVTHEYVPVMDVNYSIPEATSSKYVYLCIFNLEWRPMAWSSVTGDAALFPKMGGDVVYLPAAYEKGQLKPVGEPFLLQTDGNLQTIKARHGNATDVEIAGWISGIGKVEDGQEYSLYYWDNDWVYDRSTVAADGKIVFKDVVPGRLYKLQHPSRCFLVRENSLAVEWH